MKIDQLDMHGRAYNDMIFYYGRRETALIDEDLLRNHLFKARYKRKIPKGGIYCIPRELFKHIGQYAHLLNINFRNVQYIEDPESGNLYWIYCLKKSNLEQFKFIGYNMSVGILDILMDSLGFKLGFMRYSEDMKEIQVWYNPRTLYVLVFQIGNLIESKMLYYKRFDQPRLISTGYTNAIFEDYSFYNVPFIEPGQYKNNWTKYVNVMSDYEIQNRKTVISIFDIERGLDNSPILNCEYEEMLEKIFNKK